MLVALAEDARADSRVAWPSVGRIAERALLGERQVVRVLNELVEAGRIVPEDRAGGRRRTTRWRILDRSEDAGKGDMKSPIGEPERVTGTAGKGDIAMSPEPVEPSSPLPPIARIGAEEAPAGGPPSGPPTLPGMGPGEDEVVALGHSSRAAGNNPRARRRAAEHRERRRREDEEAEAKRNAHAQELAASRTPEALAAKAAVRARFVNGGRGP